MTNIVGLLPDITAKCGRYKRTLQQDRTTRVITHSSKHYHAPACGVRISPDTWPPTSRTTDLVDYVVWSPTGASPVTAENVTVDRLKKAIVLEWRRLSERFNDHMTSEWRRRQQHVVHQNGGHTELTWYKHCCHRCCAEIFFVSTAGLPLQPASNTCWYTWLPLACCVASLVVFSITKLVSRTFSTRMSRFWWQYYWLSAILSFLFAFLFNSVRCRCNVFDVIVSP